MKAHEIIRERVSSVVYHATSFGAANNILGHNHMGKGKHDSEFISFTRSLLGSYHKKNKLIGVIFEFDGDKLNQNYKGQPVGTEYDEYDDEYDDTHDDDEIQYAGKANGQLEDRLFIGKKGIPNVSNYIKSAIVYVPKEYMDANFTDEFGDETYTDQLKDAKQTIQLLKKHNIPWRVVKSERNLVNKHVG